MTILVKNKHTLLIDEFKFRCCIGKNSTTINKKEGDQRTPREGLFYDSVVKYFFNAHSNHKAQH